MGGDWQANPVAKVARATQAAGKLLEKKPMLIVHALALAMAQANPTPADLADARCALAMSTLSDGASESAKNSFELALGFFLGRIEGRSGAAMLKSAKEAVADAMHAGGVDGAVKIASKCLDDVERSAKIL